MAETLKKQGGAGRGQGRKPGQTQTPVSCRIDNDLLAWLDAKSIKRNRLINQYLRWEKERQERLIEEVETIE